MNILLRSLSQGGENRREALNISGSPRFGGPAEGCIKDTKKNIENDSYITEAVSTNF